MEKYNDFSFFTGTDVAQKCLHGATIDLNFNSWTDSQPFSSQEIFARFEAEVIDKVPARVEAVERLRKVNLINLNISWLGNEKKPSKAKVRKLANDLLIAETALLKLLSPAEKRRYRAEAASHLGTGKERKSSELPSFNVASIRRWVAKRAYNFGWTKKLFPNDSHLYGGSSGKRPELERIGKKYQWIALDELLCRLADNYWIGGRYGDSSRIYDNPLDVGFERDIDPTIVQVAQDLDNSQGVRGMWVLGQDVILDNVTEDQLPSWPFQKNPNGEITDHIHKIDERGVSWTTLYEYRSKTNRYKNYQVSYHGQRQQEFRFLMCVFIPTTDREKLVDFLRMKKSLDVMDWDPIELTDGPFLGEAPWRNTWPQEQFQIDMWRVPKGTSICFPVCEYIWESHLDAALPKGARAYIPSPWLAKEMKIFPNRKDASLYGSDDKPLVFIGSKLGEEGSTALIEKQALETFLLEKDLQCLWLFVGERIVWPDGDNHDAAWRRSEGICWVKNGKPVLNTWNRDAANGRSKAALPKMANGETKIKTKRKRHQ